MVRVDRVTLRDGQLEVEGVGYLHLAGGVTALELARRPGGRRRPLSTEARPSPELREQLAGHERAGFAASARLAGTAGDGRPLGPGAWFLVARVRQGDVERSRLLWVPRWRVDAVVECPAGHDGPVRLVVLPDGTLCLVVGWSGKVVVAIERIARSARRAGARHVRTLAALAERAARTLRARSGRGRSGPPRDDPGGGRRRPD